MPKIDERLPTSGGPESVEDDNNLRQNVDN